MSFQLHSDSFSNNALIPSDYTCDGFNISPDLTWEDVPEETQSFVLICDDPDNLDGIWDHWVLYNIPAKITRLAENTVALPGTTEVGVNSWGHTQYGGPCPVKGVHHYFFKLYALDTLLTLPPGANKHEVEQAMQGHILDETYLVGKYQRA